MSSILTIFKHLDTFLFGIVNQMKSSPTYQQIADVFAGLSEEQRKAVSQVGSIAILLLPFVIIVIMYSSNQSIKSEINTKKEILKEISKFTALQGELTALGRQALSPSSIKNKSDLGRRINSILSARSIDPGKVSTSGFEVSSAGKTISKVEVNVSFNDFSMSNLSDLLAGILQEEKAKISAIRIMKNITLGSLDGDIHMVHYGRK